MSTVCAAEAAAQAGGGVKMRIVSLCEEDTERAGAELAKRLAAGTVVAMRGELGAGKTAFVRGMAAGLGITSRVTSPTFAIVNEYPGSPELIHFDMYRLSCEDELYDLGWDDYLARNAVIVCEWSENVPGAVGDAVSVTIEKTGPQERLITIEGESR